MPCLDLKIGTLLTLSNFGAMPRFFFHLHDGERHTISTLMGWSFRLWNMPFRTRDKQREKGLRNGCSRMNQLTDKGLRSLTRPVRSLKS